MLKLLFHILSMDGNLSLISLTDAAFLHIDPNRLQFFEYDLISFNCVGFHGPAEWRVMTKVPSKTAQYETSTGSVKIKPAFVSHSGAYWCENRNGERTDSVNITVTGMLTGHLAGYHV